jgi:hypothetical protein
LFIAGGIESGASAGWIGTCVEVGRRLIFDALISTNGLDEPEPEPRFAACARNLDSA